MFLVQTYQEGAYGRVHTACREPIRQRVSEVDLLEEGAWGQSSTQQSILLALRNSLWSFLFEPFNGSQINIVERKIVLFFIKTFYVVNIQSIFKFGTICNNFVNIMWKNNQFIGNIKISLNKYLQQYSGHDKENDRKSYVYLIDQVD